MVGLFDIGATNTRLALAEHNKIMEIIRTQTDASSSGFAKFLGALHDLTDGKRLTALAGGFPGQVAGERGEIVSARNLPEWLGVPLRSRLEEQFDCDVVVANDVEITGLGECHAGAGSPSGTMVYYTISTGVNAVRIVDGVVDPTVRHFALGRQVTQQSGGHAVSLEQLAGGGELERRMKQAPRDIKDPKVWREIEAYVATAIYNTCLYWDPDRIVFGGSMMRDVTIEGIQKRLFEFPARAYAEWPQLVRASLKDDAGIYGALVLLKQARLA